MAGVGPQDRTSRDQGVGTPYLALIADIQASRELPDRSTVQERFEATLEEANQRFATGIAARMVITTGDEFQGLFTQAEDLVDALVLVADRLAPVQLYSGIGVGPLETSLRREAVGMDGPCFHRARAALQEAKANARWGRARGLGAREDTVAAGVLSLLGAVRQGWTDKQLAYVRATREAETQRAVARDFEVSPSVVSESLKAARYREVLDGEAALAQVLAAGLETSDPDPRGPA